MYALSVSLLRLVAAEGSEPRFMKEEEEESSEEEEEELTPEEQGRHPLRFQWNTAIFFLWSGHGLAAYFGVCVLQFTCLCIPSTSTQSVLHSCEGD